LKGFTFFVKQMKLRYAFKEDLKAEPSPERF